MIPQSSLIFRSTLDQLYFRHKCQHGLNAKDRLPLPTPLGISKDKNADPNNKTKLVALPATVPSSLPPTPAITVDATTLKDKVDY